MGKEEKKMMIEISKKESYKQLNYLQTKNESKKHKLTFIFMSQD